MKKTKKGIVRIVLGCILVLLQLLSIMGIAKHGNAFPTLSFGNIQLFFYSFCEFVGYFCVGIVGILLLALGIRAYHTTGSAEDAAQPESKDLRSNKRAGLITKRNVACVAFWCLCYIEVLVVSVVIGTFFGASSDVDSRSMIVLLILALGFVVGTFFLYRIYDPFREKYDCALETPLRFHKVFYCIFLPLGIILSIIAVFSVFSAEDFPTNSFYFIDLVFSIASLVLLGICFAGLLKLKSYAWYALMINYLVGVLYQFTAVVISIIFNPFSLGYFLASLMGTIYVSAMICLYYYKRKGLFLKKRGVEAKEENQTAAPAVEANEKADIGTTENVCGHSADIVAEKGETQEDLPTSASGEDNAAEGVKLLEYRPNLLLKNHEAQKNVTTEKSTQRYCKLCGELIDGTSKKCTGCGKQYFKGIPWGRVAIGSLSVLLVVSCALNIAMYTKISELNEDIVGHIRNINALKDSLNSQRQLVSKYESQIDFFDEHVVFVEDDGTGWYHKYKCDRFVADYFWAYNTEAAKDRGYDPCPYCFRIKQNR